MIDKLIRTLILLIILILSGTLGYMFFEDMNFWDSIYLTVVTVSTVGYGDIVATHPAGRLFSVLLIMAGVGYVMYTFGLLAESMIEGQLKQIFARRKMHKQIAGLKEHYIICGFGRIGRVICEILQDNNRPFVVVERDEAVLKEIEQLGYFELAGEAAEDEVLINAGIKRARGLIAVVSSDADNLFITLTARGLNPDLFILTRSTGARGVETKLLRAGASKVISPYYIGARRMAQLVIRPTVIDFIDLTMYAGVLGLRMEELVVTPKAAFAGKKLQESGIRKKHDIIVVAIKRQGEPMLFNPKPETRIQAGDILVVLGDQQRITALEKEL